MPEAIILVGGEGRRLQSVISDRPKPLAWVGGRFFLSHLLSWLHDAGVPKVVLAVGYRAEMVQEIYGNDYLGMSIQYSLEASPLGTGGALREAAKQISTRFFLALNGDSWCPILLQKLVADSVAINKAVCMVTQKEALSRYGQIKVAADGRVEQFAEKTKSDLPMVRNLGIYVFARTVFCGLENHSVFSLEEHLFPKLAEAGQLHAWDAGQTVFVDIGLPESLHAARSLFRTKALPKFDSLEGLIKRSPNVAAMLAEKSIGEINKFKIAVGVIVRDKAGRILLELREDCSLWGTPGGRMDFGESAEECGVREVFEETGLTVQMERFVGVYTRPTGNILTYSNGDVVQPVTIVFEASIRGGNLQKSAESLDLQFFDENHLPTNIFPSAQDYLLDCLSDFGSFSR